MTSGPLKMVQTHISQLFLFITIKHANNKREPKEESERDKEKLNWMKIQD